MHLRKILITSSNGRLPSRYSLGILQSLETLNEVSNKKFYAEFGEYMYSLVKFRKKEAVFIAILQLGNYL